MVLLLNLSSSIGIIQSSRRPSLPKTDRKDPTHKSRVPRPIRELTIESAKDRNVAAKQDQHNEEMAHSGVNSEMIGKPLQVNADNTENIPASLPQKQQATLSDSDSSPPKPVKRSTTLSQHKEGAIDKDRDARKARAESKHLDKCDRLEQNAMSSKLSEAQRQEKQDKLDKRYQKKLDKIDKRYNQKIENAERKTDKVRAKQEGSSSSSQTSTHASSAPSTPMKEPRKNRIKSFFSSIPSSSTTGASYSSRTHTSTFNPAVGGAAVMPMMAGGGFSGGIGGSGGCDAGGAAGIGGAGGCDGGGGACGVGASGC